MSIEKHNKPIVVDWQSELNATACKYHTTIVLVAAILNPIWAVADYITIPNHFADFLVIRLVFSVIALFFVFFKKRFVSRPELIAFIPFICLSIQNAYMYSVMDIPEFQKHTLAYIAAFIGGGLFVLWRPVYSVALVFASLVANAVFFSIYGQLTLSEFLANGGMLTISITLLTILLIYTRTNLTKKEIISRLALSESNHQLELQNEIIEEKSKDIRDSINYAQRIQKAILSDVNEIKASIPESFVLFKPKDIVSGDFYWFSQKDGITFIAAADCTGHGVPGAFMSMIANSFLNEIVNEKNIVQPDLILNELRNKIIHTLRPTGDSMENRDGLDIVLCTIKDNILSYAGANNPLWVIRDIDLPSEFDKEEPLKAPIPAPTRGREKYKLVEIPADRQPIGTHPNSRPFALKTLRLLKGDVVYLFTDGYADQFGGSRRKKFMYRSLAELFLAIHNNTMDEQKQILDTAIEKWRGDLEQVDDILIVGLRF